ncbi:MAG: exodeoxyribonuclease V subunit gamma [Amphritea sp.]
MFRIYHSNKLDMLKDLLVEMISREPLANPFDAETILVQSPGMAQWLKLEMAEKLEIAANIDFPLPASFLWSSFSTVLDGVPERSAFNKEALTWTLMELLPQQLQRDEFSVLQQYLHDDDQQFKLYQLCGKVADIFDQYLVYRPDWIASWEQGDTLVDITHQHPWQPILWQLLVERIAQLGLSHWHRGNMFSGFVDGLLKGGFDRSRLPERLFVFGISALPQNFIDSLQALGKTIDVHLMITNPCRYFWGDIVDPKFLARLNQQWLLKPGMDAQNYFSHGNPLLSSMGKLGRDYLYQLQELAAPEIDLFEAPVEATLLTQIQQDILELQDPSASGFSDESSKTLIDNQDCSIQLHSVHSPLREVEVLHDRLLAILDADHSESPRDIIVMMPDVATYAPYIEAVFGNTPAERYIPYSISDRTLEQESPLLLSFMKLLELPTSRLTVSDVLEILEVPAVMRRFELDEDSFDRIRRWVEETNIRWGLDAEQRDALELPAFEQNSWRFGLKRMLAGYAMGRTDNLWQGIEPYIEVEGLEAADLGQLAEFVELLDFCISGLGKTQTIEHWLAFLNEILLRAFLPDEQDEMVLSQIRKTLEQLQQQLQDSLYQTPISAPVLQDYLKNHLGESRSSQRFLVGAVNFCTLMPMRSIPFRTVCLLGMNDGVYPRSIPPMGFDLMTEHPRRGDRSRRDDDRYLFLEALLSARDKLYISYVGRNVQDNSAKVPSVLISELVEYCQNSYRLHEGALLDQLLTEHPLQPFSPSYFDPVTGNKLFSYAADWLPVVVRDEQPQVPFIAAPLAQESLEQLELNELLAFVRNPVKHFFQRRLKVYFIDHAITHQDEEPFQLDGLENYQLKQLLLATALKGESQEQQINRVQASGLLPVGLAGKLQTRKLLHDCAEMAEKIAPLFSDNPQRRECRLQFDETQLTGWLRDYHEQGLLRYRPANMKGRDLALLWIEHLVAQAMGHTSESYFFGLSGRYWFKPVARELAYEYLSDWITLYKQGLCEPMPLLPDTAWELVSVTQSKDQETGLAKAQACFTPDRFTQGEGGDMYIARVYADFAALGPRFIELSNRFYGPLLDYVTDSNSQEQADD